MLTNILKYIISAKLSISFYITNRILDFCIKIFNLSVSFLLTFAIHVSVNRRCRNHHIKTATMSCPVLLQLAHRRLYLQKTSASADLFFEFGFSLYTPRCIFSIIEVLVFDCRNR